MHGAGSATLVIAMANSESKKLQLTPWRMGACSFAQMKKILDKNLDRLNERRTAVVQPLPDHSNVRGPEYYQGASNVE